MFTSYITLFHGDDKRSAVDFIDEHASLATAIDDMLSTAWEDTECNWLFTVCDETARPVACVTPGEKTNDYVGLVNVLYAQTGTIEVYRVAYQFDADESYAGTSIVKLPKDGEQPCLTNERIVNACK